jgi:FtsZ-binding cell division protein ZapB
MEAVDRLGRMSADELREFAASLIDQVSRLDGDVARLSNENVRLGSENRLKQFKIDQLTHEMAVL